MSFSLSAPAPPMSPATPRKRGALLLASVALHVAILGPVLLNKVFIPSFDEDRNFQVWLEMERTPREMPRPEPRDRPIPVPAPVTPDQPVDPVVQEAERQQEIQRAVETLAQANPQASIEQLQSLAVELVEQRAEIAETLDQAPSNTVSDLNTNSLPSVTATITRPVIEAIDGPMSATPLSPLGNAALPTVQAQQADTAGRSDEDDEAGALDVPVPRRARMDEGTEAALAAAAAGGALDDAWTYRPEAGSGGGGALGSAGQAGSAGSRGPDGNNTATSTGRIYYGGSTTPVDCTQPQMLSDVQRLSCDSAEARRLRASAERGMRVQGTGNAGRDGYFGAVGAARLESYESLRSVHGGTGIPQTDPSGSGTGDILDEMSGTNREVRKLQEQIGASSGHRAPNRRDD